MCSPALYGSYGTVTRSGCGVHVDQVLRNVAPKNRCTCH